MKRSKRSKVLSKAASASVLASFMFLAACGGGGGNAAGEKQDPSGKVTLNFITQSSPLAPADPNEKLINKRLEEKRMCILTGKTSPETCLWKKKPGCRKR